MKTRTCVNNAQQKPDISNISAAHSKNVNILNKTPITKTKKKALFTFKIHLPVAISIEDVNDALHEWILLELRQGHELVNAERPRIVQI